MAIEKTLVGEIVGFTEVFHISHWHGIRKVTEFSVKSDKTGEIEKMKIHGKHDILVSPNRVDVRYTTPTKVNWVNYYFILDKQGNKIYKELCD